MPHWRCKWTLRVDDTICTFHNWRTGQVATTTSVHIYLTSFQFDSFSYKKSLVQAVVILETRVPLYQVSPAHGEHTSTTISSQQGAMPGQLQHICSILQCHALTICNLHTSSCLALRSLALENDSWMYFLFRISWWCSPTEWCYRF